MPIITPRQIRGARAMLGWSMPNLAKAANVSVSTVKRAEDTASEGVSPAALNTIRAALEAAGVQFPFGPAGAEGITIRAP